MELDGCTPEQLDAEAERRWLADLEAALAARGEGPGLVGGPTGRRHYHRILDAVSGPARHKVWTEWGEAVGIGRPPPSFGGQWPSDEDGGVFVRDEYAHEQR